MKDTIFNPKKSFVPGDVLLKLPLQKEKYPWAWDAEDFHLLGPTEKSMPYKRIDKRMPEAGTVEVGDEQM